MLAIEQTIDESSGKPVLGQTVTMEVDPKQAETLALGARMGELSLVLQDVMTQAKAEPLETTFTSETDVSEALGILGAARATAAADKLAAEQAAAASRPAPAPVVEVEEEEEQIPVEESIKVYRSTTSTEQSFTQ